jgi:hypothetical protein
MPPDQPPRKGAAAGLFSLISPPCSEFLCGFSRRKVGNEDRI